MLTGSEKNHHGGHGEALEEIGLRVPRGESSALSPQWLISDGLTQYPDALAAMQARVTAIRAGEAAEAVWLLEHPPLFTAGTSAQPGDISNPAGFPTYAAGRGGQWTYHGPGQRLAYVMLDLTQPHGAVTPRDVRRYVWALEEWLILTLAAMNVRGERRAGRVGIWVDGPGGETKIAAIGVRVTRWVSWHGISLNIAPTLAHFEGIVPCGIREHGVTSLEQLGITATMPEVDALLRETWSDVFGRHQP